MSDLPDYIDRAAILTEGELHRLGLSPEAIDIVQALQFQLAELKGSGDQLDRILNLFGMLRREIKRQSRSNKDDNRYILPALAESPARILSALLSASPRKLSKAQILNAIYDREPETSDKIIDVWICKLRRLLSLIDVEITTIWGRGYLIDAENKAVFEAHLSRFLEEGILPKFDWSTINKKAIDREIRSAIPSAKDYKDFIIGLASKGMNPREITERVKSEKGVSLKLESVRSAVALWRSQGANIPYYSTRPRNAVVGSPS